jgi:hypothetical protein
LAVEKYYPFLILAALGAASAIGLILSRPRQPAEAAPEPPAPDAALIAEAPERAPKPQTSALARLVVVAIAAFGLWWVFWRAPGFDDEALGNVRRSIAEHYPGAEVKLLRDGANRFHATGFVKVGGLTLSCDASIDEKGEALWRCAP